jgi:DNA topoisomerase-2
LAPNGQFGTRLEGGKDSAAPRYIFTALEPIVATMIAKADDPALQWLEDDGARVEPEYYMPVLPLALVNGADGIGTGFSSHILPYSPVDLVGALRARLRGEVADLTDRTLVPWWDGFKGTVTVSPDGKRVVTKGCYAFFDDEGCRVRVTELPVGMWTKRYKEFLEKMLDSGGGGDAKAVGGTKAKGHSKDKASVAGSVTKLLRSYQENYNDVDVEFVLSLDPEYYAEARAFPAEFEKKFKLTASTGTTNMVAFGLDGRLRRFASAGELLETFYVARRGGYVERKANELARLDAEIVELDARVRFVRAVVTGSLVVANAADEDLLAGLKALPVPPLSDATAADDLKGYEYLLRMRVDRLKAKAVADLEEELAARRAERDTLAARAPEDLWLSDLTVFEEAYAKFMAVRIASRSVVTTKVGDGAKKKVVRAAPKKAKA